MKYFNPLSANSGMFKCSNTLKQFVGKLPMICFSVFDNFFGFAFKGLIAQFTLKISEVKSISKIQKKTLKGLTQQSDFGKIRLVKAHW